MALPFTFGTQSGSIPLNELDENFQYLENLVPPLAVAAATVTAASQPNITAVGTLTTLSCTGTITSGTVTAGLINGVLQTASQPNITQIGGLTNLTVSNVLTVGTVTATQVTAITLGGTLSTAAQPGVTSLGTLTSLSVTGNVQGGNLRTAGDISAVGTVTCADASVANLTASNVNAVAVSITGNVQGGNLRTVGLISATGNVIGNFLLGNGSQLTGMYSNTNVAAYLPTYSGSLSGSAVSVSGNVTGGNLSISGTSNLTGAATASTAANGTSNTQIATTAFVQNSLLNILPSGLIVMWSGSVASIPTGWLLCNGTSGTPDLRDRFIVGAGSTYNPGVTGGSADAIVVTHTHSATSVVTDPGHLHTYTAPVSGIGGAGFGTEQETSTTSNTSTASTGITVATTIANTGSSGTNANLPPYYALAYIMKA